MVCVCRQERLLFGPGVLHFRPPRRLKPQQRESRKELKEAEAKVGRRWQ